MNKKCMITTKSTSIDLKDTDVYYIEDYIGFGNVTEARVLTDNIFTCNKEFIKKYDYDGYKVTWAWYDQIYHLCLSYTEIHSLLFKLEPLEYDTILIKDISSLYKSVLVHYFFDKNIKIDEPLAIKSVVKQYIINTILLTFTGISVVYFFLRRKKYVAIRIEDILFKETKSDFRFNNLYETMQSNNIDYIEFIRSRSLKDFIINTLKRKRFSIYYDSIYYFVGLFTKNKVYEKKITNFHESVLYQTSHNSLILINTIKFIEKIYKLCQVKKIITISFSYRSASLSIAAKSLNIKIIGMMHGLSRKDYVGTEFIEPYAENKYIGPDIFGVWSNHFVQYYKKYCKIVPLENIVHSGLLRPFRGDVFSNSISFSQIDEKKIRVLIISEPLVSAKEILPYIKELIKCNKFQVSIKVRPMIKDSFYEELKDIFPDIKALPKYDGKILDDGLNFDLFVGSHSTAVIEASLINKISILIRTEKWGDHFDINQIEDNLLCEDVKDIVGKIEYRVKNENRLQTIFKIKEKFFGSNKDGTQWIIEQLTDYSKN